MNFKKLSARDIKRMLFNYNSIVILLLLLAIGSFFIGRFTRNYTTILTEASLYAFIAIGLSLVMISGHIDLSVGFQAATSAVVLILVINSTGSVVFGVIAAVTSGLIMGAINGAAVAGIGISPLIATIATNYIYMGFVYFFTRDGSIYPEGALRDSLRNNISRLRFFNTSVITLTVVLVAVALIVLAVVLKRTNFGSNLYITGDNAEAGKLAGINTRRTTFYAYILCGCCCGVAGVFLASSQGAAIYTLGEGRDVFAISACVIGGIRMAGGKGTMLNVLIGVIIMRMISTGMNLLFITSAWVSFVSGVLLLSVLLIDKFTSARKA